MNERKNSSSKKNPLVITDEVYEAALKYLGDGNSFLLFGHKNAFKDEENIYDLIFHSYPRLLKDSLKEITTMVIPAIPNWDDYEVKADEMIKKFSWIDTIATDHSKYEINSDSGAMTKLPRQLRFLTAKRSPLGTSLKPILKYTVINEKELIGLYSHSEGFLDIFDKHRKIIDKCYSEVFE